MMNAYATPYALNFITPGGTSRGVLTQKETHFMTLSDGDRLGIGECAVFRGLSRDDRPDYAEKVQWACDHIHLGLEELREALQDWPTLVFGLETAFRSLYAQDAMELYPSAFLKGEGIPINGLIWMGNIPEMQARIEDRLKEGYSCLKLKIGALHFEQELQLIQAIRARFSPEVLEIRVDANGAFSPTDAMNKLTQLASLHLHSIEQPLAAGQWEAMARLCRETPLPIALDEELIALSDQNRKAELLDEISPQFLILKPALLGGFQASEDWIALARKRNMGWWVTSALESNIGLNAIAQWTATLGVAMPQGLGTGSLYSNNFDSPLQTGAGRLWYRREQPWNIAKLIEKCT
jgi:o-succinylbenzoate synthase